MGWLKSLFKKEKEEPKKAFVPVTQLAGWFDDQTEELIEEIKQEIAKDIETINSEKVETQKKLELLQEAKLLNDKLPERAIQIMAGNRTSFINSTNIFLKQIETPTSINLGNIAVFLSSFEDALSLFNKSSARNYHVLQEFLSNETNAVARHLKNIEEATRNLLDNNYKDFNLIRENISRLNEHLAMKNNSDERLHDEETDLNTVLAEIKGIQSQMESIKSSRDYKELGELDKEKKEIQNKLKLLDANARGLFLPLEKSLKKFAKISFEDERILTAYSDTSLQAIIEDKDSRIINILAKLKNSIANDQLGLNDKKMERACSAIDDITIDKLKGIRLEYEEQKEAEFKLRKREGINTAAQKISELDYKLEHLNQRKKVFETEMGKIKKQSEAISPKEVIREIQKEVEDVLEIKLRITGWKDEDDKESE